MSRKWSTRNFSLSTIVIGMHGRKPYWLCEFPILCNLYNQWRWLIHNTHLHAGFKARTHITSELLGTHQITDMSHSLQGWMKNLSHLSSKNIATHYPLHWIHFFVCILNYSVAHLITPHTNIVCMPIWKTIVGVVLNRNMAALPKCQVQELSIASYCNCLMLLGNLPQKSHKVSCPRNVCSCIHDHTWWKLDFITLPGWLLYPHLFTLFLGNKQATLAPGKG